MGQPAEAMNMVIYGSFLHKNIGCAKMTEYHGISCTLLICRSCQIMPVPV